MKASTKELLKDIKASKTYKGDYYTVNSIFGNNWAMFYILLGGREAGKSYSVMKWACNRKMKLGDDMKFFWFRLTDSAAKNLLAAGADKFIDPDIKRKMGLEVMTKNSTVYTYRSIDEPHKHRDGTPYTTKKKVDEKVFCEVLSCSTFYNTKGVGYFDNEFQGEYLFVLDEMNREQSEKNSFDIVYNFVNLLENTARSTKNKIKVVMIGNTLDEASDILAAFNFIPDTFGRYKLKSKRCVIDYIKPNEKYLARRKGTIADILLPGASTFTNEVKIDRSLLVNKRKRIVPMYVVKFNKSPDSWFTVWNNNIVSPYNKELVNVVPMRRYLDETFEMDAQKHVLELFDARAYKFISLACFKNFQKQLRLIKK